MSGFACSCQALLFAPCMPPPSAGLAPHSLKRVLLFGGQVLVMSAYMTPNQDMAFVTAVSYVTLGSVVAGFMCRISNMVRALLRPASHAPAAPPPAPCLPGPVHAGTKPDAVRSPCVQHACLVGR